ncbi:MAG: MYG1 family protein [Patescibacteria group bacterium]|nr:MYG1 family protein [Patescibacteria group bacterium]
MRRILFNRVKIITHNGGFHADDVFAVAAVKMWVGKNSSKGFFNKPKIKVIRTRDEKIISEGDFVVDIGGEYDFTKKFFDHHQLGGAGKRSNGIPFSSFGLVWKEYGKAICDSQEAADLIDSKIVQSIDAVDNGVDLCNLIYPDVKPYFISDLIGSYNFVPKKKKGEVLDGNFLEAVSLAKNILGKEIEMAKVEISEKEYVREVYQQSGDKKIIILNKNISDNSWGEVLIGHDEPLYVVKPDGGSKNWKIKTVRKNSFSFENRKDFPENWAGKTGSELSEITGVQGCIFCHNKRFITVVKSREGSIELARLAVEN